MKIDVSTNSRRSGWFVGSAALKERKRDRKKARQTWKNEFPK